MKLLLFSDVHENRSHCENLVRMSREADLVIGAGDFGTLRRGIGKTIGWLSGINKASIIVPGNSESYEELKEASKEWPSAVVLHGTGKVLMGISFFGVGGGIPVTPFGPRSYDFSEEEAENLLIDCPEGGVLIVHSPPKGIVDISSSGQHLGSRTIRKIIMERSPSLVVCGHIHESGGRVEKLCETVVVNAGPGGMYFDFRL
ncbi:MAG: metallophosphoesterase family protein [Cyclobacteriaceae bacterium]|nr:metallophosphoesterase family protein [Cyclobacteriaceae bacterium]